MKKSAAAHEIEKAIAEGTRTLVVGPYLSERAAAHEGGAEGLRLMRSPESRIEEAAGLTLAIDLQVVGQVLVTLSQVRPATFLGKGKLEELAARVKEQDIELVMMDCALSPVQQRNLEKELGAKVIDRTGLILEIFGRRARTREGTLQVELAHLDYQKSRLVRSWTHLERQRGGYGFLGGPGETQIETDRRLIQDRMVKIQGELEAVKRTRALHRAKRSDVPFPIIALVGYTNAGKSTLFNTLTKAEVLARDMLFATLDPTLRALKLPYGGKALLSDTVGFISDLPTMLVSAFRATLEEVISADVILHVRDISHEDSAAQRADVESILDSLGITPGDSRLIEVWNKADLIGADRLETLQDAQARLPPDERPMLVSAVTGQGLDALVARIDARLAQDRQTLDLTLPSEDGQGMHWLYENTEVMGRRSDDEGRIHLTVRVAPERVARVRQQFNADN